MGSGNGDEWSSDGSSGSDSDSYSDSDSDSSGSDSDSEEAFEPAALRKKKKAAPKKRKAKAPKKRKQAPKPQDAGPESWAVSKAWRQMSFAERSPPIAESDGSAAQAAAIEEDEDDEDDEPQVRECAAAGPARLPLPPQGARCGPRAWNGELASRVVSVCGSKAAGWTLPALIRMSALPELGKSVLVKPTSRRPCLPPRVGVSLPAARRRSRRPPPSPPPTPACAGSSETRSGKPKAR